MGQTEPSGFHLSPHKGKGLSGTQQFPGHSSCPTAGKSGFCEGPFCCLHSLNKLSCKPVSFRLHRPTSTGTSKSSSPCTQMLGGLERALLVQAERRRCPAAASNPPRPTESLWPFHQLSGSISLLQMVHGCFLSDKEMDNAGAVASLSIPLTCREKNSFPPQALKARFSRCWQSSVLRA